jgi:pyruvate,orthophosphate dikinase
MYADVVLGVDHGLFESILDDARDAKGVELDTELDAGDLKAVAADYKAMVERELGRPFPDDVNEQFGAPSAPCSAPGTAPAPTPIAG